MSKLAYIVMEYVLDTMNTSRIMSLFDTWGYLDKSTNKVNGLLGALLYNESDVGCKCINHEIDT